MSTSRGGVDRAVDVTQIWRAQGQSYLPAAALLLGVVAGAFGRRSAAG